MKNKHLVYLSLSMLLISAGFLAAENRYPVAVAGVTLETPVPFSQSSSIGLDAYSAFYPAGAKPGAKEFEITFVFFSVQMQGDTGFSGREMLDYARSIFLGMGRPANESKTRVLAGKETKGDIDSTSIPHPAQLEIYLLSLTDGRKLALAFKASAAMDKSQAEKIIAAAAQTFAEIK